MWAHLVVGSFARVQGEAREKARFLLEPCRISDNLSVMLPGFAFILNRILFDGSVPAEICPGILLDQSNPEERTLDDNCRSAQSRGKAPASPYQLLHYQTISEHRGRIGKHAGAQFIQVPRGRKLNFWVLRSDSIYDLSAWRDPLRLLDSAN